MMRALLLVVAVHGKRAPPLGGRHGARLRTYAQLGRRRVPPPGSTPDHVKRVYDELDRSVAYFPQTTNRSDAARIVAEWPSLDKEVRAFTDSVERRIYGEARTETPQERAAREAAEKAAANGDSPRDEL